MLNLFNKKEEKVIVYKTIEGKLVQVKEWPTKEASSQSWGRSGYDSLYN